MEGKVALVTGGSSGIGKEIVAKLVENGMQVITCARNIEKLNEHALELNKCNTGKVFSYKCDLQNEEEILAMFKFIKETFGVLDVCVNNAGIMYGGGITDGKTKEWRRLIDLNVVATCIVTREACALMESSESSKGHIINMASLLGRVMEARCVMYCATKCAVLTLGAGLRKELRNKNSDIRVTSISPGLVHTELYNSLGSDAKAGIFANSDSLSSDNVANAVMYAISAPSYITIDEIVLTPTRQVF